MHFPLGTDFFWEISNLPSPSLTFLHLNELVQEGDHLVLFSYEPDPALLPILRQHNIKSTEPLKVFKELIHMNVREYPLAEAFTLPASPAMLGDLAHALSGIPYGYDLFIDHFCVLRRSIPLLPLLAHRNLRHGYPMQISGLYDEATIQHFCQRLEATYIRTKTPY